MTSANYPATEFDLWFTAAEQSAAQSGLAGHYSTTSGIRGDISGTIAGTIENGTLNGTLTYESSPNGDLSCRGSGVFSGTLSPTELKLTSPGFRSSCPADPVNIAAQLTKVGTGPASAGRAELAVAFHPDPVPGFRDPACPNQNGWRYAVTVRNVNGVGMHATSWTQVFSPAGTQSQTNTYPESDIAAQFGSSRFEPFETRSSNLIGFCLSAATGTTQYTINGIDDRGNAIVVTSPLLTLLAPR